MATRRTKEPEVSVPPSAPAAARGKRRVRETLTPERRRGMIAEAAYLRAERRGFAPGSEVEDWLAAEREIDALLSRAQGARQ